MVTESYELAIDLDNGEWICDVAEHRNDGKTHYIVEVTPPDMISGQKEISVFKEMRMDDTASELRFYPGEAFDEHYAELEKELSNQIINRSL